MEDDLYVEPGLPFVVSFLIWFFEGIVYVTFEVLEVLTFSEAAVAPFW